MDWIDAAQDAYELMLEIEEQLYRDSIDEPQLID
jgi:hypothetical protein